MFGAESVTPLLPLLVDATTLASRLDDATLRVLDATVFLHRPEQGGPYRIESGRHEYEAAHIPGAAFADIPGELSDPESPYPFTRPGSRSFAEAAGRLGIGPGTHVVAYAQDSPMWATRLWWLLRSFGFDSVSVLDGGLPAWRAGGLPEQTGSETYAPTIFVARPRPALLASRDDVERVVGGAPACLVNTLTPPVFRGEGVSSYSRPGRIPSSINAPWTGLVDPESNRFKPREELRRELEPLLARDADSIVAYCGGGISATVDLFALSLVGHEGARLYDGSLTEWSADPDLPLIVG